MTAVKDIIKRAKTNQKEVSERMDVKQSTLSNRMNKEIQGSIEWSIEIAKEFGINRYSIARDGYIINVKIKR